MATIYKPLTFERSKREGLSLRLAIEETVDIAGNKSMLRYWIEYQNSGAAFTESWVADVEVNGIKRTYYYSSIFAAKENEWVKAGGGYISTSTIAHDSAGDGTYSVGVEFKTDQIGQTIIYRTVATATATGTLTPIDQTPPMIDRAVLSVDRYGENERLDLKCSHAKYNIIAYLTIWYTTDAQADARWWQPVYTVNGVTVKQVDMGYGGNITDKLFKPKCSMTTNGKTIDTVIPLLYNTGYAGALDSGGIYNYSVTVTAANSKSVTVSGVLAVPQKVTGIAFDDEALTLAVGESATPEYNISPGGAEVKAVSFESSDSDIATVSADGEITAVSEGGCTVTVTSADHGRNGTDNYTAVIQVSVVADSDGFPQLSAMDYLGVVEISRLSTACTWLANKLGKAAEMQDVVCQGRAHPVTDIRAIMEALEANVAALSNRPAVEITKHNDNWYGLVNGWVNSLNELYELNKEG